MIKETKREKNEKVGKERGQKRKERDRERKRSGEGRRWRE